MVYDGNETDWFALGTAICAPEAEPDTLTPKRLVHANLLLTWSHSLDDEPMRWSEWEALYDEWRSGADYAYDEA